MLTWSWTYDDLQWFQSFAADSQLDGRGESNPSRGEVLVKLLRTGATMFAMDMSMRLRIVHLIHINTRKCGFHKQWQE